MAFLISKRTQAQPDDDVDINTKHPLSLAPSHSEYTLVVVQPSSLDPNSYDSSCSSFQKHRSCRYASVNRSYCLPACGSDPAIAREPRPQHSVAACLWLHYRSGCRDWCVIVNFQRHIYSLCLAFFFLLTQHPFQDYQSIPPLHKPYALPVFTALQSFTPFQNLLQVI